uniref:Uncharacterized protein n=1 Tax=Romanomermis culicivorax TaxID=13658 RepID=A0A915JQQ3_ROMCU
MLSDLNYILQSHEEFWNVRYIIFADFTFGLFGGYPALLAGLFSYASTESYLTDDGSTLIGKRMAIMEGTMGVGSVVGFLLCLPLNKFLGYKSVFVAEFLLHLMASLYIIACIRQLQVAEKPDEDTPMLKNPYSGRGIFGIFSSYVGGAFTTTCRARPGHARRIIWLILLSFSVSHLVFSGEQMNT